VPGIDFIMKLQPVTYHFDARKYDAFIGRPDSVISKQTENYTKAEATIRTGFIAQDVEKAAKELGFEFSAVHKPSNEKDNYSLAYAEFTVPLVKAVQEQQKTIIALEKKIEELMTRIDRMDKSGK
jgi:trimeric autotransporter adhesin